MNDFCYSVKRKFRNVQPGFILLLLLFVIPEQSYCSTAESNYLVLYSSAPQTITTAFFHLLLTILGALIIICTGIIFFWLKLKKINRELTAKNERIEEINSQLQKTNHELEIQKELLARKYYESDKFFSILIQSADDGI